MDAYKISVKIFAEKDSLTADAVVPVFHRWIQEKSLPGHMLIDVADYAHVPDGPGTVLISSEANLYTDRGEGKLGLLYSRKLPLAGTFAGRLKQVLIDALTAAWMLEREPGLSGKLKFRTDELLIRLNDRLLAPNTAQTLAEVRPDVEKVLGGFYGAAVTIQHKGSDLALFEVLVKGAGSPTIEAMLGKLSTIGG